MKGDNSAFRKLSEDPATKARLKELSRRADTGIETGMEEVERSQKQAQVGSQTSANMRALAAASASTGVKGATQASKIAGVLAGGMGQMGAFESDLAARDLAAKQAASERKAEMSADIAQFDIGQDRAKLEFDLGQERIKSEKEDNARQAFISAKGRAPDPIELMEWMGDDSIETAQEAYDTIVKQRETLKEKRKAARAAYDNYRGNDKKKKAALWDTYVNLGAQRTELGFKKAELYKRGAR